MAALLDIGLLRAADVIGGYQARLDAGVPSQLTEGAGNPAPGALATTDTALRRWL